MPPGSDGHQVDRFLASTRIMAGLVVIIRCTRWRDYVVPVPAGHHHGALRAVIWHLHERTFKRSCVQTMSFGPSWRPSSCCDRHGQPLLLGTPPVGLPVGVSEAVGDRCVSRWSRCRSLSCLAVALYVVGPNFNLTGSRMATPGSRTRREVPPTRWRVGSGLWSSRS